MPYINYLYSEQAMSAKTVNPWEEIPLSDYENHMKLDFVQQLQTMNRMMRRQFALCGNGSAMVLGIAGGNGLEHAIQSNLSRVYGVDINSDYLRQCKNRYPQLDGILECICADLTQPEAVLPHADLIIANLLVEYIGYDCFCRTVSKVCPRHVSCIIQINMDDSFVSDSPYLHAFDGLERVHHQMQEAALAAAMETAGYILADKAEELLPNGKKLVELDFISAKP